jgi:hypothetical protein
MKTYKGRLTILPKNGVFVFGSNRQGIHGAGAALDAKTHFGARPGWAYKLQGRAWAICTKDLTSKTHPSVGQGEIVEQIQELYEYAWEHPELEFYIAYSGIGINLNYYTPQQMADMFSASPRPENIVFEETFSKLLTL